MEFDNKRIIVTGATGEMGITVAKKLDDMGATLILTGRNSEKLQKLRRVLNNNTHMYIPFDFSKYDEIATFVSEAAGGGKLWGIAHCAGVVEVMPLRMTTPMLLKRQMYINFYVFTELVKCFSSPQYNHPDGGSIIAISSIASVEPEMGQLSYGVSKASLDAYISSVTFELASKNIRINSICAGVMSYSKKFLVNKLGEFQYQEVIDRQKLGLIDVDALAETFYFLLSNKSLFITGTQFLMDGGRI